MSRPVAHVRSYELFAILRNRHPDMDFDQVMAEVDERLADEEQAAYEASLAEVDA